VGSDEHELKVTLLKALVDTRHAEERLLVNILIFSRYDHKVRYLISQHELSHSQKKGFLKSEKQHTRFKQSLTVIL